MACSAELQSSPEVKFPNLVEQRFGPARNAAAPGKGELPGQICPPRVRAGQARNPSHPLRAKNGQTGERGFTNEEKAICARN